MNGRLEQGLKIYANAIRLFVVEKLKARYGEGQGWLQAYLQSLNDKRQEMALTDLQNGKAPEEIVDITHLKDVFLAQKEVFRDIFQKKFQKVVTWADEIADIRNAWAHQQEVSNEDVYRALDCMARVLEGAGAPEDTITAIKALRDGRSTIMTPPSGSDTLPNWWQVAIPHSDIRAGEFDESTFAAKLDDVVRGRAGWEYQDAEEFFRKTYLTRELRSLLQDVLRRLQGVGGEAVVQLRTPFGGGKTHALIALYHLVHNAQGVTHLPTVRELLAEVKLSGIPRAQVAVLVGTDLSPQGRTLWGELAAQLGGQQGYALVQEADEARLSPGKERLRELLQRFGPSLILMDELLVYQVKAAGVRVGETTLQAQTFAFLQELSEVVSSTPQTALVLTFPESHLEYYDQQGAAETFARLEHIFGRVQAVRVPVQGEDIYEVIRRRLFAQVDEAQVHLIVDRYLELYRTTKGLHEDAYRPEYKERMRRAFPFHPELIRTLQERWGTLQKFQRTRGVLRLLARVVEESYRSPLARPLISLGDVHLENPDLRATIASILQEAHWESVIAADITGKAAQIDRDMGGEYSRQRLAQTLATAIFMYSHSGGAREGIRKPLLDLALMTPTGLSQELLSDALDKLQARLFYLYEDKGFLFKAQPNLNAVLANEVTTVAEEAVCERLQAYVKQVAGRGELRPVVWPTEPRDVPDDRTLKLVLYGPDHLADAAGEAFRQILQQQATGAPRLYKNTLLHLHMRLDSWARLEQQVRMELALENIRQNLRDTLSASQQAELERRLKQVKTELPHLVRASYSELYRATDAKGTFRHYPIQPYVQKATGLVEAVETVLQQEDLLLKALDPEVMINAYGLWPEQETFLKLVDLRDYFFRLPELPMLANEQVLAQAVCQGWQQGLFELGYRADDQLVLVEQPTLEHCQWTENHVLVRPGVLSTPEPAVATAPYPHLSTKTPTPLVCEKEQKEQTFLGSKSGSVTQVTIALPELAVEDLPRLIDVVQALQEAGGQVRLQVQLEAVNGRGLRPEVLSLSVRELLDQYGWPYNWDES